MSSFSQKLKAARDSRPTKDVRIILDEEVASERAKLTEQLEDAPSQERLAAESVADQIQARIDQLNEAAADSLVTIRLTRIPGKEWALLTSTHPLRPDSPIDRAYGYNFDAVCEAAARFRDSDGQAYAHRVEGEEVVEITDDEWTELFDVLSGAEVVDFRDNVWALNDYEPQQRLAALVKSSGAATRSVTQ